MNFSLHTAETTDIPALVASLSGLFAEDGARHDPHMDPAWPRRGGADYFTELLAGKDSRCWIARADEVVAGHLAGRVRRSDPLCPGAVTGVLESMRVAPEHRRSGAGTALMAAFRSWAKENGANRLRVTAYAGNANALEFYRHHGFAPLEVTLQAAG